MNRPRFPTGLEKSCLSSRFGTTTAARLSRDLHFIAPLPQLGTLGNTEQGDGLDEALRGYPVDPCCEYRRAHARTDAMTTGPVCIDQRMAWLISVQVEN